MNASNDPMPFLEESERPWTEAESRVRDALLRYEETPPSELEGRVMRELGHSSPGAGTSSYRLWIPAAGLIAIAGMWWITQLESPSPIVEEGAQQVDDPIVPAKEDKLEVSVVEAKEVNVDDDSATDTESQTQKIETTEIEVAEQKPIPAVQADTSDDVPVLMEKQTASSQNAGAQGPSTLQLAPGHPQTETKKASLEVKD